MKLPLISVVIPTYNREGVIKQSIDSVLTQTWSNLEIIVVDDCSTDQTETLIRSLQDERIRYVKNSRNMGAGGSRNIGMQHARGEYIAFQDSDDIWHFQKLEKQMKALKEAENRWGTEVGLVYCQCIKDLGGIMRRFPVDDIPMEMKEGDIFSSLLFASLIGTQTMLMKRQVWERIGGFCEELRNLEEWEYCIRIAEQFPVAFVNEPLVTLHYSENNISSNAHEGMIAEFYILKKIEKHLNSPELIKVKMEGMIEKRYNKGSKDIFEKLFLQYVDHLIELGRYEEMAVLFTIPECQSSNEELRTMMNKILCLYELQKEDNEGHILTKGKSLKEVVAYYCNKVEQIAKLEQDYSEMIWMLQMEVSDTVRLSEQAAQRFGEKNRKQPQVSIILPVSTEVSVVKVTIDSIVSQLFSDWELIVVGDGAAQSQQEMQGFLEEYQDDRIYYIMNAAGTGLISAYNEGAVHARGNYLAFCSCGDVWDQEKLKKQMAVFTGNEEAEGKPMGVVYCGSTREGLAAQEIRENIFRELVFEPVIIMGTILTARSLWRVTGGFLPEREGLAAWEYCLHALQEFRIQGVDEVLVDNSRVQATYGEDANLIMRSEFAIFQNYYDYLDTSDKLVKKLKLIKKRSLTQANWLMYQMCLSQVTNWMSGKGLTEEAQLLLQLDSDKEREEE